MKNIEALNTSNKQALTMDEMENVGGGFLMNLIAGAASMFVKCFYDVADAVNVAIFGLPKDYHH